MSRSLLLLLRLPPLLPSDRPPLVPISSCRRGPPKKTAGGGAVLRATAALGDGCCSSVASLHGGFAGNRDRTDDGAQAYDTSTPTEVRAARGAVVRATHPLSAVTPRSTRYTVRPYPTPLRAGPAHAHTAGGAARALHASAFEAPWGMASQGGRRCRPESGFQRLCTPQQHRPRYRRDGAPTADANAWVSSACECNCLEPTRADAVTPLAAVTTETFSRHSVSLPVDAARRILRQQRCRLSFAPAIGLPVVQVPHRTPRRPSCFAPAAAPASGCQCERLQCARQSRGGSGFAWPPTALALLLPVAAAFGSSCRFSTGPLGGGGLLLRLLSAVAAG